MPVSGGTGGPGGGSSKKGETRGSTLSSSGSSYIGRNPSSKAKVFRSSKKTSRQDVIIVKRGEPNYFNLGEKEFKNQHD